MSARRISRMLAVDLGNSAVKFGRSTVVCEMPDGRCPADVHRDIQFDAADPVIVRANELLASDPAGSSPALRHLLAHLPGAPQRWFAVSVNRTVEVQFRHWLGMQRPQDEYRLLDHQQLGLATDVEAPHQIGTDRLAAAVAANAMRAAGRAAIVVDAGTAVTVDLVTSDGVFRGGAILPGMRVAAAALARATDALPLIEPFDPSHPPAIVGKSTQRAICSGVFWGCVGAVRELISRMRRQLAEEPDIFCTGGDGKHLVPWLDPTARFDAHLVLRGIAMTGLRLAVAVQEQPESESTP